MGILDKIKDLFLKEQELKIDIVKINLSNLINWVEEEENKNKSKKEQLKLEFESQRKLFVESIKKNIVELKEIDFSKYKVEDKIKIAVKQGLLTYIMNLNSLTEKINQINGDVLKSLEIAENEFASFEKVSNVSFQKSTVLVGKEIGKTVNTIKDFIKHLKNLKDENSVFFKKLETLESIKNIYNSFNEKNLFKYEILKSKKEIEEKLYNLKENKVFLENKFHEFKKSKDYQLEIENEKKIAELQKKLHEEVTSFRRDLDLKFLNKFFHYDTKMKKILDRYSDDIISSFKLDPNFEILYAVKYVTDTSNDYPENLLKVNKSRIEDFMKDFRELEKMKKELEKPSLKFIFDLKEIQRNLSDLENEKDVSKNKEEKVLQKQQEILDQIKGEIRNYEDGIELIVD